MNGWHDKSAGRFFVSKDLSSVQGRLGSLDGAAITRTTTSGAERREVNLGSAGEYAGSYDVVHDDAAGAAGDGQAMAGEMASIPPLETGHFGGKATDCSVPYRRTDCGMDAGLEVALKVVVAVDDPGAYRPKRIGLPALRSDWGKESRVSPGDRAISGFQAAGVNPGRRAATVGCAGASHDLPEIGGIEN